MTLTDFLLARIAEDYADATSGWHWKALPAGEYERLQARVLAECEAKRRIVQVCSSELSGRDIEGAMMDGDDGPWLADHILHTLATVYADHPDCREEWKP